MATDAMNSLKTLDALYKSARLNKEVKEGTGIQVPNTVKFAEPVVHAVKNLSKIPLFNIVIEFKIPH